MLQLRVERNPARAYQPPRVSRHVNDGRAFLTGTDTKYDLILFALPDSLTLVSGASQIRLESFLFTDRAIEEARDHLKPGGAFAKIGRASCRGRWERVGAGEQCIQKGTQ